MAADFAAKGIIGPQIPLAIPAVLKDCLNHIINGSFSHAGFFCVITVLFDITKRCIMPAQVSVLPAIIDEETCDHQRFSCFGRSFLWGEQLEALTGFF